MINGLLSKKSSWEKLAESENPIVIYGMGNGADKVLDELCRLGIAVAGVFASDAFVRGQSFRGYTVKKLSDFEQEFGSLTVAVAFATCIDEVIENVLSIANRHTVLVPCVPVYGNEIFNRNFVEHHARKLEAAYSLMSDNKSKEVFEGCVQFLFGGELDDLIRITTDKDEAFNSILKLSDSEDYLDLGAYKGDTVEEFLRYTDYSYSSVTAVEADRKTFAKLEKYLDDVENSRAIRAAVFEKDGVVCFDSAAGRQSTISKSGEETAAVCVDSLCTGRRVSYIKADVEGAENEMLEGARKTLATLKPKLNIAAYHRSCDIFSLALKINEINPDYKIYLRRHKYIPCWDMNLYCI